MKRTHKRGRRFLRRNLIHHFGYPDLHKKQPALSVPLHHGRVAQKELVAFYSVYIECVRYDE
mgnify:FL=1